VSNFYGELLIRITSDTAGLSKGLQQSAAQTSAASKAMEGAGKKARVSWERVGLGMQNVGRTMSQFVTIPIAAGFAVAGIAAFKFQDSLMKIQNLTGTSAAQTKAWGEELLKLGAATGQTPLKLAESLYFVASSGFKGAEAMDVIKVSAKAAAAGLGDVKVTADVLTSAMNSYGHGTYTAAEVTDYLMKTIEVGKAEPVALATSLGRIMPVANQLKIGLDELGGNVAALTLGGLSSAEAVTALRGTMIALVAPAKMSIDQLKKMGLSYRDVKRSIADKGLLPTLKMLWEEVDHNELAMRKLIPNTRALNGVLSLLGANYGENLKVIDKVAHAQGALDKAMKNTAEQPVQKLRQAWAALQAEFIKAGALILPVVAGIAKHIVSLASAVNGLSPGWRSAIMWTGAFVAALGPVIMVAGSVIRSVALIKGALASISIIKGIGAASAAFQVGGMTQGFLTLGAAIGPATIALGAFAAVAGAAYGLTKLSDWLDGTTNRIKAMKTAVDTIDADKTGSLKGKLDRMFGGHLEEVKGGRIVWKPQVDFQPPPEVNGLVKWVRRSAAEARTAIREKNKMILIENARGNVAFFQQQAKALTDQAQYARTTQAHDALLERAKKATASAREQGLLLSQLSGQMSRLQEQNNNLELFAGQQDRIKAIHDQVQKVAALRAKLAKDPGNIELGLKADKAERRLEKLQKELSDYQGKNYEALLDVKIDNAKQRLSEINRALASLRKQKTSPEIRAQIAAFLKERDKVKAELRALNSAVARPTITADGSQALAVIGSIQAALSGIRDKWVSVHVNKSIGGGVPIEKDAWGGYYKKPRLTVVGDNGPKGEVILPLDKPGRMAQLMQESGVLKILAASGRQSGGSSGPTSSSGGGGGMFRDLIIQVAPGADVDDGYAAGEGAADAFQREIARSY
jgi:TP901 family phage tail tape measure protein